MEIAKTIAPICLAIIMFGLGLGLTISDFTRVVKSPKDFIVGFISQVILLPIIALTLISIITLPLEIALGVMIIAAAPGGVTSNVMTKFAKGDVALSVSLTAVISLISIISVPIIVLTSANLLGVSNISQEITLTGIALKMAGVVTVPVIIGMIVRRFFEKFISTNINIIEKITYATIGNAVDFGDLVGATESFGSTQANSSTRGIFAGGGDSPNNSKIEFIEFKFYF